MCMYIHIYIFFFFFSSRRRHTRCSGVSWARNKENQIQRGQSPHLEAQRRTLDQLITRYIESVLSDAPEHRRGIARKIEEHHRFWARALRLVARYLKNQSPRREKLSQKWGVPQFQHLVFSLALDAACPTRIHVEHSPRFESFQNEAGPLVSAGVWKQRADGEAVPNRII